MSYHGFLTLEPRLRVVYVTLLLIYLFAHGRVSVFPSSQSYYKLLLLLLLLREYAYVVVATKNVLAGVVDFVIDLLQNQVCGAFTFISVVSMCGRLSILFVSILLHTAVVVVVVATNTTTTTTTTATILLL